MPAAAPLKMVVAAFILMTAAAPSSAQNILKDLRIAPALPANTEPEPELPDYAIPDLKPNRLLLPDLNTPVVSAHLGLEFIFDWTGFRQDETSLAQVGPQTDRFEVRSASGEINGEFGLKRRLSYKVGIEYNGFDVDPDDAFAITDFNVSFAIPAWRTKVSVGQMREDFSYEVVGSTATMPQAERIMSPFGAPQNTGLKVTHLFGANDRTLLTYGIFRDEFGEGDGQPAVSARLTRLMIDEPGRFLHLGFSVRHADTAGSISYRARPGVAAADEFVDTGEFPASNATHIGVEAHYSSGPWSIIAEYASAHVDAPAVRDPVFRGYYLLGSWVITGERRSYDRTKGSVRRILPLGRWGAPELVVRYAAVDLNGGDVRGGRYDRLEVGGNWWATTRWKLGFLYGRVWLDRFGDTGVTQSLQTRLQWVY